MIKQTHPPDQTGKQDFRETRRFLFCPAHRDWECRLVCCLLSSEFIYFSTFHVVCGAVDDPKPGYTLAIIFSEAQFETAAYWGWRRACFQHNYHPRLSSSLCGASHVAAAECSRDPSPSGSSALTWLPPHKLRMHCISVRASGLSLTRLTARCFIFVKAASPRCAPARPLSASLAGVSLLKTLCTCCCF